MNTTTRSIAQQRSNALKDHARTEGRSADEVLAAYTTPQPPEHLNVHHLAAHMIPPPTLGNPLPHLPLVLPKGEAYVVLDHLAWNLDFGRPGVAELEACARAWAAELPAHQRALAELWVNGFPLAPVPCLRWPLLRAFLQHWQGGGRPGTKQQRLLAALTQDAEQVAPEDVGVAPEGRPPKINEDTVRQLYQLLHVEGKSRMEAAAALDISVPAIKKIVAGSYPFSSVAAKDAWSETFGTPQKAGITG